MELEARRNIFILTERRRAGLEDVVTSPCEVTGPSPLPLWDIVSLVDRTERGDMVVKDMEKVYNDRRVE